MPHIQGEIIMTEQQHKCPVCTQRKAEAEAAEAAATLMTVYQCAQLISERCEKRVMEGSRNSPFTAGDREYLTTQARRILRTLEQTSGQTQGQTDE